MDWPHVLGEILAGRDLDRDMARAAMGAVMAGDADPARVAALIVSLRLKGESVDEMAGMVEAMYEAAVPVEVGVPVVDTAGTGGDRSGTFNVSTTAAFIAAGAGARVAKHGNRAASSRAGSADVLEALGVPIDLAPDAAARSIREAGFGFLFAPRYHPAMRHVVPVRKALGVPTVFNFLGPLANPARAEAQVVGVSDPGMAERMIRVLDATGTRRAFVVHGEDGLDELTTTGPSVAWRLEEGRIARETIDAADMGLVRVFPGDLIGGDAAENAGITLSVLEGAPGPKRDLSLLNAAPAIVVAGLADTIQEGLVEARRAIDEGLALAALEGARAAGEPGDAGER